jgi:hypothetical protein
VVLEWIKDSVPIRISHLLAIGLDFHRPYQWWDRIKPGWNPPFGNPTFETPKPPDTLA